MRVEKILDYARATSAAAAAAAAATLPLLLDVYTAATRRLSIDATGARCAVWAWGVLCDVRVWPQSPEHDDYQVDLQQK